MNRLTINSSVSLPVLATFVHQHIVANLDRKTTACLGESKIALLRVNSSVDSRGDLEGEAVFQVEIAPESGKDFDYADVLISYVFEYVNNSMYSEDKEKLFGGIGLKDGDSRVVALGKYTALVIVEFVGYELIKEDELSYEQAMLDAYEPRSASW